jgi:hypothetical protein
MKGFKLDLGFIVVLFILIALQSCIKDVLDMKQERDSEKVLDASIVSPLAYGTISVQNFITKFDKNAYIYQDDLGYLYMSYTGSVLSYRADEVISIPVQNHQEFFYKTDADFPSGQTKLSFTRLATDTFSFSNGEKLDSIWLKSGTLTYTFTWTFKDTGNFIITFPSILKNGTPLSRTFHVSSTNGNTAFYESADISDYHIRFSSSILGKSFLNIKYTVTLYDSGLGFSTGEKISMVSDFTNLKFKALFGYIGNYELINKKDTVTLGIFDKSSGGTIVFADPRINLAVNNSFGVPVQLITTANSYSQKSGQSLALDIPTISPLTIGAPTISEFGQNVLTSSIIDSTTSNINTVMETMPNKIMYSVTGTANPDGTNSQYNFVMDTSHFNMNFTIVLPLYFKASGFSLSDTSSFSIDSTTSAKTTLNNTIAHLVTTNSIPFALNAQVYFLDANNLRIDSMFKYTDIIEAAVTNGNGIVTSSTYKSVEEPLTKNQISKIMKKAKKLVFIASFSTSNKGLTYVKFYSSYNIKFHFGITADGTYLLSN